MILHAFEFNLFGEQTYIIWDEISHDGAVIDPGMSNDYELQSFDRFIESHRIELRYLLYTHLHIDHTLGHEHITEKYGLRAMAHPADAPLGQARSTQADMFHMRMSPKPLIADLDLYDGQLLPLSEETIEVINVPGHSPGSVAYYCKDSNFVITGDALFCGSIGRTDLPGGNHEQLVTSIRKRLLTLPPRTKVYPGHGPMTTIDREILHNPFL